MDADRGLVEAAAGGSREAFDELVRRHQTPILNLVRAMTGGQRSMRRISPRRCSSGPGAAWRVPRGQQLPHLAVQGGAQRDPDRTAGGCRGGAAVSAAAAASEEADARPSQSGRSGRSRAGSADRDAIDHALGRLPEELRVAVTLRDVQGLDYRAIAELTGVPIGTVESRIFRARQTAEEGADTAMKRLCGRCSGGSPGWWTGRQTRADRGRARGARRASATCARVP